MINTDKLNQIKKAKELFKNSLTNCCICPRRCGVDRAKGKTGYCRAPLEPVVYSCSPHHGEEPPLSGRRGSGTIFFTHCNMRCVYCQNYYFSQLDNGKTISVGKLAELMIGLQEVGCHNINLVSPTHFVPQILMALEIAVTKGLDIPIVYNTGGYDSLETIKILEGVIDIYMPDMRYSSNDMAKRYSDAPRYIEYNRMAVKEMHRQVGDLILDKDGIAKKGIITRLLALPEDISGILATLAFIRYNISQNTYLSIMSQYYPTFKAYDYRELSRGVTNDEYRKIVDEAKRMGLNNGWIQEEPLEFEERFFGTNIKPKTEV